MHKRVIFLILVALALAACSDNPPPTQIYVVISPTPEPETTDAPRPTSDVTIAPPPTTSPMPTAQPTSTNPPAPTSAPASTATPAPEAFPTNTIAQVQIAEQVYQRGRMFWIRPTREIWVMQASPDDPNSGDWFCYNDTFEEGEMEIDPNLYPPENGEMALYQPRRGFGKLWRNHDDIRDGLGWATTPEFELTSSYVYIPGGYVEDGQYYPGPGEHRLTTLYNESISFYEDRIRGDCQGGTWRMTPAQ